MKSKILITLFTISFLTANAGLCEQTRSAVIHEGIIKFGLTMAGVLLSSVIIFAGLSIYNKFFVKKSKFATPETQILKTPTNIEEAIKFYINKNKLD